MKTLKFLFFALFFSVAASRAAHLPEMHRFNSKNSLFVKTTAPTPYPNNLQSPQPITLAKYYAGSKQKTSLFSKPFKLSFKLSKCLLLHLSYN